MMRTIAPILWTVVLWLLLLGLHSCIQALQDREALLVEKKVVGLDFENTLIEDDHFNIIQYLYFYNGGGVAVGDVNNDGLTDIYLSANQRPNRLFLNLGKGEDGKMHFEDITEIAGIGGKGNWSTGVSMVDINGDGWLDIYLCQLDHYKSFEGKNQFFINNGCMDTKSSCQITFTDMALDYGLDHSGFSTQAAFFDYDIDGDLDMYLLCHSVHSTESYRDTASTRLRDKNAGDKLFENQLVETGKISFEDVSERAGIIGGIAGYGLGVGIGDLNRDGYPDIYVSNDFHENDFIYLNNGDKTFQENAANLTGHTSYFSMGNDIADFNNDGWLDVITLDMKPEDEIIFKSAQGPDSYKIDHFKRSFGYHYQYPRNMLQINQGIKDGEIRFSDVGEIMGLSSTDWSWAPLFIDLNLDGWKDLFITNGIVRRPNDLDYLKYIANQEIQTHASDLDLVSRMPEGRHPNYLFININGEYFERSLQWDNAEAPTISTGIAYADFDRDGDLDLVINNINAPASYLENVTRPTSGNSYIEIDLDGPQGNRDGIGSLVEIRAGGLMQLQEVFPVRGWQSCSTIKPLFGLGEQTIIDTIRVTWFDGKMQQLVKIMANQTIVVKYENAQTEKAPDEHKSTPIFTDATEEYNLGFVHRENNFFDHNREPLIPYVLSTEGPSISVADFSGDGLDDFYIGGASGQTGQLFFQDGDGFYRTDMSFATNDIRSEDVAVISVDVENDGDLDLYIGSAGNQLVQKDSSRLDRLYLNDGLGNFSKVRQLPEIYNETSCVLPADFDDDGDTDLFIGSRSQPVFYGRSPDSYLLLNDGLGNFEIAATEIINASQLGMVTDGIWYDIDGDIDLDLIVVGEWMPVVLFRNKNNHLVKETLSGTGTPGHNLKGWWQSVDTTDFDRDGDIDFILGNFGLNCSLNATPKEPVRLYLADFDRNLSPDPILSYYRHGIEYPVLGLDELGEALIFLKKKYRSYQAFATESMSDLFTQETLDNATQREVTTFASMSVENLGNSQLKFQPLPAQAQISSTHAISSHNLIGDAHPEIILAGNKYGIIPAVGKMDASYGTILQWQAGTGWRDITSTFANFRIEGEVRDLSWIKIGDQPALLVARNDASLQCFRINVNYANRHLML